MIDIQHAAISKGQTIQNAYDEFFQRRSLLLRDSFYMWILELANPAPGDLVVDVACGNGRLVELAAMQGMRAVGVDLSYQGIAAAAACAPKNASWLVTNGQTMALPDASVDRVICLGSLEHYDDPIQGAAELARILKPSGRAVVLLPNAFGIFGNIKHVWLHGEVFDDGQPHQRYATRATWETMLRRAGLMPERLVPWIELNRPRTRADFDYLLRNPQKFVRAALVSPFPVNLANQLVWICRRATAAEQQASQAHSTTLPDHFARTTP